MAVVLFFVSHLTCPLPLVTDYKKIKLCENKGAMCCMGMLALECIIQHFNAGHLGSTSRPIRQSQCCF